MYLEYIVADTREQFAIRLVVEMVLNICNLGSPVTAGDSSVRLYTCKLP